MANGFACFSSVQHAESLLPGSLGLVISAVTGDLKQCRVAQSMTPLPERLDTTFFRNVHVGKLHFASLVDKIRVTGDP